MAALSFFLRRSEEHTSELQSRPHLVCRLLLEKKKGLELVRGLPPSSERLMTESRLQVSMPTTLIATTGYSATQLEKACKPALELCKQLFLSPYVFHLHLHSFPTRRSSDLS